MLVLCTICCPTLPHMSVDRVRSMLQSWDSGGTVLTHFGRHTYRYVVGAKLPSECSSSHCMCSVWWSSSTLFHGQVLSTVPLLAGVIACWTLLPCYCPCTENDQSTPSTDVWAKLGLTNYSEQHMGNTSVLAWWTVQCPQDVIPIFLVFFFIF